MSEQAPAPSELEQVKAQLKWFQSENNACKQMINEGLQVSLNLRTNLGQFQESNNELTKSNQNFIKHVQNLLVKIEELEAKIADDERVIGQLREALGQVPAAPVEEAPAEPVSDAA